MKFTRFPTIFLTFCLIFTISTHAQGIPTNITGITITSSTDNPVPGQTVTVTAASYSFDIESATIIWTVDGKQVQKGVGLRKLETQAPTLGKKKTIGVDAVLPDGNHFKNTMTLGSGSMDLIVETDGYTPPFFKGKTPLAFQNNITIIAIPHLANSSGKEYDPASLIYQWKKDDGTILQDQSGYGKQSITLKGNIVPRPYYLIVTANSRDGTAQAQSLIQINPTTPSIVFYPDDPLYGPMFNSAINGTLNISTQRETRAFASLFGFNFSPSNIANDLSLSWIINNIKHDELSGSQSVTLRAPSGVSGSSQVYLNVRGVNNILQGSSNGFNVSFDASNSSTQSAPVTF
jgi:hypothetical protein